jgi:hypothetical protein
VAHEDTAAAARVGAWRTEDVAAAVRVDAAALEDVAEAEAAARLSGGSEDQCAALEDTTEAATRL